MYKSKWKKGIRGVNKGKREEERETGREKGRKGKEEIQDLKNSKFKNPVWAVTKYC